MWHLLRNSLDWEKHCTDTARATGAVGTLINWGAGPQSYPCLVASYPASPLKIVSAYVYQTDAVALLAATDQAEAEQRVSAADIPPLPPSDDDPVPAGNRQSDYNKSVSAHLLAIVHFLVETRICKREQYDAKYTEALACVDEWSAEDRDNLLTRLNVLKDDHETS